MASFRQRVVGLWYSVISFSLQSFVGFCDDLARDHELLDLARPLVDAQRTDLAVEALDRLAHHHPPPAEQLDRVVDYALGRLGREQLGHRGLASHALGA